MWRLSKTVAQLSPQHRHSEGGGGNQTVQEGVKNRQILYFYILNMINVIKFLKKHLLLLKIRFLC